MAETRRTSINVFEVACDACGFCQYIDGYWNARAAAMMHWERTTHRVEVKGGDDHRTIFTAHTPVTGL